MPITVTARLFAGRPDPVWTLNEADEAQLIRDLSENPAAIDRVVNAQSRLGYSGLQIDLGSDQLASDLDLPASFMLHSGATRHEGKAQEIAIRLIERMFKDRFCWEGPLEDTSEDETLRGILLNEAQVSTALSRPSALQTLAEDELAGNRSGDDSDYAFMSRGCTVESGEYRPLFWNDGGFVQKSNNCYCYAANRRIDKFGWPGKGGRKPVQRPFTAENVAAAMIADGLVRHGSCLPDTEKPRYLVALVIAKFKPDDPNYNDFHFLRNSVLSLSNQVYFWSHKPGQFPVSDSDLAGRITNVERSVARQTLGKYTIFGGYFYLPKSAKIEGNPPPTM